MSEQAQSSCNKSGRIFNDYLGDLAATLPELLNEISNDWRFNIEISKQLDELAQAFVPRRLAAALLFLDLYDVIEVSSIKDMLPSQKAEWCWYHYN